jgi:hypothetical protein
MTVKSAEAFVSHLVTNTLPVDPALIRRYCRRLAPRVAQEWHETYGH